MPQILPRMITDYLEPQILPHVIIGYLEHSTDLPALVSAACQPNLFTHTSKTIVESNYLGL